MPKIDPVPQNVSVSAIRPGQHRTIDPAVVQRLATSIRAIGLLNPITVRRLDADPGEATFVVVAGDHRLAAAKASGLRCVPVHVVELADLEAQIATIDENLYRHNLTPAEETAAIARRKTLWDAIRGTEDAVPLPDSPASVSVAPSVRSAAPANADKPTPNAGGRGHKGFVKETADLMDLSPTTSHRVVKRAEVLGEDASKLVGTSLDRPGELDALAAVDAKTRADLIERATAGEKVSAKPRVPHKAPASHARPAAVQPEAPAVAPYHERTPEDYVDDLMQALRACAAHLSIDAIAKYQITGRLGHAERELIHSLAMEPAMADVQDGLFDPASAHGTESTGAAAATEDVAVDSADAVAPTVPASTPAIARAAQNEQAPASTLLQRFGLSKERADAEVAKAAASPTHTSELRIPVNGSGRWHPAPDVPDLLDTP